MNTKIKVKVIIGSVREGRFAEKPAAWIAGEAKKMPNLDVEVLDLKDYPMPFFDEATSPSVTPQGYDNPVVKKWATKIADGDAFIIVTPEYNHGPSAVLKNAIDYVYAPWNKKPVGFVGYGSVLGARSIEQLRLVMIELQMAPIRISLNIPFDVYMNAAKLETAQSASAFASLTDRAKPFLEQLTWWAKILKLAREKDQK